ncbi:hypothetical protein ABEX41_12940 [Bacillus tropicus]|uniref:Uncharacterized protein n=1 Tax=Bacillus tropicus TaxID=2026188 RepID=A0A5C5A7D6_9BACI|nr:hypothetical protein [Bacillus tropicus]ALL23639.1 hypothetical protein BTXL6_20295 [Bacillus thuringiensis]EEM21339.1 hypothetical protein bthur0001_34950 [Bacillus thuringiensis serovar tochigiensis BGSC 4Y1]TNP15440.1 hypothetical protein FHY71_11590 [Bacillus tropicus]
MQLTKIEKAIFLGTILNAIDEDKLEDYVELESLRTVANVLNKLHKKTKPEEKKEAITSLIGKLMHELSKGNDREKVVQFRCISCGYKEQYTERKARTKDGLQCKYCKRGGAMINEAIQNQTTEA